MSIKTAGQRGVKALNVFFKAEKRKARSKKRALVNLMDIYETKTPCHPFKLLWELYFFLCSQGNRRLTLLKSLRFQFLVASAIVDA